MSIPTKGYGLKGLFNYGFTYGGIEGTMQGKGLRFDDGRLVGIIEDKDENSRDGTSKYLLGQFHSSGLSLLKIPPVDRGMMVIAWALREKENGVYQGGWVPLGASLDSLGLSSSPSLQHINKLDIRNFEIITEEYFDAIISDAEGDDRKVELTLSLSDLATTRNELGI